MQLSAVAAPCDTHMIDGGGVWGGCGYWFLSQYFHLKGWNQGIMCRATPFLIFPPAPSAAAAASYRIFLSNCLILSNITKHGVLCVHSDMTVNYHDLAQCAETPLPWPLQLLCMPHHIATDGWYKKSLCTGGQKWWLTPGLWIKMHARILSAFTLPFSLLANQIPASCQEFPW